MWEWLEAGNKAADFIRENGKLLNNSLISTNYAFKMFYRIKKWHPKVSAFLYVQSGRGSKKSR
jgi:hypothetical protein